MKVGNGIERTENDQPRMYWSSNLYRRVGLLFDRIYSNEDYDNNDCDDSERESGSDSDGDVCTF